MKTGATDGSKKTYIVYCHTNLLNGKRYVGITSRSASQRWNGGNGYKNNEHFYRAIKKYGWLVGFSHEILLEGVEEEVAKAEEARLISLWKTTDKDFGYNISSGWDINDKKNKAVIREIKREKGLLRQVVQVETGEVFGSIAEAAERTGIDESAICGVCSRKKYAITAGGFHWQYIEDRGKGIEKETKKKTSSVENVDTGKVYEKISDAAKEIGIHRQAISYACHSRSRTAGGFHWRYLQKKEAEKHTSKKISVKNLDTGETFSSISEAAKVFSIHRENITAACAGRAKSAGGYRWKFEEGGI